MRCSIFLLFLLILARAIPAAAQSYAVTVHRVDEGDTAALRAATGLLHSYPDPAAALKALQDLIPRLHNNGYLAASIDSVGADERGYTLLIHLGLPYRWARVTLDSLPPAIVLEGALQPRTWTGQPLAPRVLSNLSEKLLRWADDNGYPFATVALESARIDTAGGVSGDLRLRLGPARTIDTVIIAGDVRISRGFLYRYLALRPGDPYTERTVQAISTRLRELPFLSETQPWEVTFRTDRTQLALYLQERRANSLNGLIGLLPNTAETGKFLLTVDAAASFQNALGAGESFAVTYQNLQYRSPRLKADVVYPYLGGSPVGAEVHFDFFRRDTAWRRTSLQAGGRYAFTATDFLRVFYQAGGNRLITVDTALVRATRALPPEADVSTAGIGTEAVLNRTDFRPAPRRGPYLRAGGSALRRRVRRHDAVLGLEDGSGFNWASLYDSLGAASAPQYRLEGEAGYFLPLGRRLTLRVAYAGGYISGARLFRNEVYQIGGFRLLRGFDEQSIFTPQYHVGTVELRAPFGGASYAYLFSDNGLVDVFAGTATAVRREVFNGFGVGTTLETKSGVFSIAYALGRSGLEPQVALRRSKVHFGYVAYF